jgi:hypothetical protein
MKFVVYFGLLTLFGLRIFSDVYSAIAFGLTLSIAVQIILQSNESFMFREWALLLYALNYLLSPAITYQIESEKISYTMKITSDIYFSLAFPGFLLFALGMFIIPTQIFKSNLSEILKAILINERFLIQLTIFGFICRLISDVFSTDFAFFFYLLSLLRFVGVFALFASNSRTYGWLTLLILGFEIYIGFKSAMFHDSIMWCFFLALFYMYIKKPKLSVKIIGAFAMIVLVLLVQSFKSDYRQRVWFSGETASLETILDVGSGKANSQVLIGEENLLGTLNRGNQAWIFASTVDNIDRTKDLQGMNNINLYLEAALLPRFLAPNKITAGDKRIFNHFSGHQIGVETSMGLGVFADGYIAYGKWGVYIFAFVLGLLFALTFKLVEGWSKISPFYVLLILPMLNYAVRPDCESQTIINHLAKSIMVFSGLVYLTKYHFTLDSVNVNKK